jgi:hypothetical protein
MSFLNSLPLWSALAALGISVPIVIHLWSRRQKVEINWAAMELLKKAMVARSQQIRMEDRLLLLLRCLTLLLIALALLRPLFNDSSSKGSDGAGIVIAIDASFSMAHGEPARFEKALAKAREILSTISEGDPVSIVLMSSKPKVLFRRTGYDPGSFTTGLDKTAKVSSYPLNMERNLELLLELSKELKTASRECYIITDAQVNDWQALSDQARNTLQELSDTSRVIITPVQTIKHDNLAITDFSYSAGSLQRNGSARFSAGVRNTGSQVEEGASVEFLVNGKLKARKELGRLEAGQTGIASFYTSFEAAGDIALTARLSKDSLKTDNERHVIAGIRSSVRVLCIDGDASDSTGKDAKGAFFAIRALRLKHSEDQAPIKVTHVDTDGLYGEKLNNYDVIMMFNVAEVNKDLASRIQQFVDNGGGLMAFLGDKVDPDLYNKNFAVNNKPVLPVRLLQKNKHKDPAKGWQITSTKSDHALSKLMAKLPEGLVAASRFHTAINAEILDNAESIINLDNGQPLLVGSRDGRILVFTSSADRSWSNFPVHPLFMILLQQASTMLSNTAELTDGIVGEQTTMLLPGRLMGDDAQLKDPSGATEPIKVTVVDGSTAVVINPDNPGIYHIPSKSGLRSATIAANVETTESDVRTASTDNLDEWLGDLPVEIITESVAESALNSRSGRDLSLTLLILGAICFFAQGLLANHMSRRKHAVDGGMVEALQKNRVAASRRS